MRRVFIFLILLALGSLSVVHAQQGATSAIRGRIVDQQHAVLPAVAIVVTHAENGTTRETVSGEDGTFLVPGLVPGRYKITAELQGFSRLTQEDIVLRIGTTQQLDLTMRVGAVEENLTVTAEAPQVDLTTAQVGGNVSNTEIANLPNGNGNFTGLIAILPGVVYTQPRVRRPVGQRHHQRPAR
jgi:hypothetical protein